jgi:hypothetical protein
MTIHTPEKRAKRKKTGMKVREAYCREILALIMMAAAIQAGTFMMCQLNG